ncbi:MAG TPA: hypothetical protein VJA66_05265 [Thermoanaerobaculia bacterium]
MGILDNLKDLARQAASGNASTADVHDAFDQVAKSVPQGSLADGIAHAFNSDKTPPFEQMVSGLFGQSSPEQKAGLLNQLLGSLGPQASQALAAAGGVGALQGLLSGKNVTPQQAQQVPPQAIEAVAQQAARKDPSIVDRAAGFYAQHPDLVKGIGVAALGLLMSRISASRR